MELSYCVVNTNGRELLLACLEAIARTHPAGIEHEILVLDNASDDGSAEAVRARGFRRSALIARERRAGKAENDSLLLREARGRFCLLLNEDSESCDGRRARRCSRRCDADPRPPPRARSCSTPTASPIPCAWRFPGLGTAARPGALPAPPAGDPERRPTADGRARSAGSSRARCSCAARPRAEVGYLDPDFFVYSDECDFRKRLHDAGWRILHVPAARAVHHEQLATDRSAGRRGSSSSTAAATSTCASITRAAAALSVPRPVGLVLRARAPSPPSSCPDTTPGWYWLHARQALRPTRGEGMREAAEAYNAQARGRRMRDRGERPVRSPGRSSSRATAS